GAGYVEVPRSDSTDSIVDQVSMAAWVYLEGDVPVDYVTAISKEIGSSIDQYYHLAVYKDASPSMYIWTGQAHVHVTVANPVARFAWTLLVGTYDGANARLYVDGNLVQTLPATGSFAADPNP